MKFVCMTVKIKSLEDRWLLDNYQDNGFDLHDGGEIEAYHDNKLFERKPRNTLEKILPINF